ncbi:MAG: hypothetical protein RJA61_23 [Candidatus Parcubacteria bacterium]|jgi:uncharacterized protein (TIGR00730 family)
MDKEQTRKHNEKHLGLEPLSLSEVHNAIDTRIGAIQKEFKDGFEFLVDHPKSVTFFGSARLPTGDIYYEKARSIAAKIVHALGYSIVTGGGPGIMEAANKGGFEAKGKSLGLTIKLPKEQITNPFLTEEVKFHYFFSRKVCLSFSAEAYLFFPGGFGTLDELFEILTLVQTHKIEKVPVILVGTEYWKALDVFMREQMLAKEMIDKDDVALYHITEDENEIIEIIKNAPIKNGVPIKK